MKINNRTHPGLNKIIESNNDLKIYCYANSFMENMFEADDKIEEIIEVIGEYNLKNEIDTSGIYIFKNVIIVCDGNNDLGFDKNGNRLTIEYLRQNKDRIDFMYYDIVFHLCVFKKYAEIETKLLPPKTESNDGFKCVYSNHSKYPITFINSTWFTNLVKSDAFKVSGHFRLQPCHDLNGMPTKKLIWISDYIKSGYTAPARKLNHE